MKPHITSRTMVDGKRMFFTHSPGTKSKHCYTAYGAYMKWKWANFGVE